VNFFVLFGFCWRSAAITTCEHGTYCYINPAVGVREGQGKSSGWTRFGKQSSDMDISIYVAR